MIYSRIEFARIGAYVFAASFAAWAFIVATPFWSAEPAAIMCGSSWTREFTPEWIRSVGVDSTLMIVAMMAPMTLQPLCHIRISSFSDRRGRSVALFLVAYAVVWLTGCFALKALEAAMASGARGVQDAYLLSGMAALVACVWQASPFKQWCLNQCHDYPPLAAYDWHADRDVLRFGLKHGIWCFGSCWALMLFAGSLAQWHLAGMAAVALIMFCERLEPPLRPAWRLRGFRMTALRLRRAIALRRQVWSTLQPKRLTLKRT
jgi:predicted metal-binding membrane protein